MSWNLGSKTKAGVGGELPHSTLRVLDETHDVEAKNQVSESSEIKSCLKIMCVYRLESLSKYLSEEIVPPGNWSPKKCNKLCVPDGHEII